MRRYSHYKRGNTDFGYINQWGYQIYLKFLADCIIISTSNGIILNRLLLK